jgi:hypothetical protein
LLLLLLAGAWIGYVVQLVVILNFAYGLALSRQLQKAIKKLAAVLVLPLPLFLLYVYRAELATIFAGTVPLSLPLGLALYLLGCLILGLGVLPLVTLWRLLRPRPAVLLSNHTRTVDIADCLGFPPEGRGKYRLLTRLPGNEVFQVDFSERIYCLPRLPPALDGLSILHLSDLHLCGTPDRRFFQEVMDRCREWQPDLVALTGDIVDSEQHHRWIVPVLGRLRWNLAAYAILGNHDGWHEPQLVRRRLQRVGFRVLGNAWETLPVRGLPLVVIGHEGPWFRPAPDLAGCPEGPFRLLLSHTPDNLPWARRQGIDLMLAGHNHGGQIRFPVLGSVFVPSIYSRRYDCGSFHHPPTLLHVSRGLSGQQPLRYNCRPEVTRIVLRAAVVPQDSGLAYPAVRDAPWGWAALQPDG